MSIAAQKEECVRFVGDSEYRIYCDDGKSGKDVMHRPAFMQMMSDARVYADAAKPSARGIRAISPHSESHFAGS